MAKTKNKSSTGSAKPAVLPEQPPVRSVRRHPGLGGQIADAVTGSVDTVRSVLPAGRLPVYLADGALVLAGLIDPPAAIAVALGYEALRRWQIPSTRDVQTRTAALT